MEAHTGLAQKARPDRKVNPKSPSPIWERGREHILPAPGKQQEPVLSTHRKRDGTSPELKNPQTKEKITPTGCQRIFPGSQCSKRGDNCALLSAYRHENSHGDKRDVRKRSVGRVLLFTCCTGKERSLVKRESKSRCTCYTENVSSLV